MEFMKAQQSNILINGAFLIYILIIFSYCSPHIYLQFHLWVTHQ